MGYLRPIRHSARVLAAGAVAALVVVSSPPPAGAVIPGPNGKIVFTSGRNGNPANDDIARLFLWEPPGGLIATFTTEGLRHSHPAWSPDRTMIAYTRGPAASDKDIFIKNVKTGVITPVTNTPTINEDRAAFSPDGTRLAYGSEVSDGSNQTDIYVDPLGPGATINLTSTPGVKEDKPAWTPDSQTIYYSFGDVGAGGADIYREKADNSQVLGTPVVATPGVSEWQPALSPDGTKLCYTRGPQSSQTDIYVVNSTGAGIKTNLSDNAGAGATSGAINCVWSPDSTKIAYVRGVFLNGALAVEAANDTGAFQILSDAPGHFDGNPDWAPDPSPTCQAVMVTTAFRTAVTAPLSCNDPAPESKFVSKSIASPPENGTLDPIVPGEPGKVKYSPNQGFAGTDSFTFTGSDGNTKSTATKVVVTVLPSGQKPPADPVAPAPVDVRAAAISGVSVSPRTWRRGSALPRFAVAPRGTTIGYRLSEAATATLTFQRAVLGRRIGRRCLAATPARRARARCVRSYRTVGSLTRAGRSGRNTVKFAGRLSRTRRLAVGRHRIVVGATDRAGNRSAKRTSAAFAIVAR